MAFDVVAASYREQQRVLSPARRTLYTGLLMGVVCVYAAAVGILKMFNDRWIIADVLTLGQTALILAALSTGVFIARKTSARSVPALAMQGFAGGAIVGGVLSALLILVANVNLRHMFVALSKPLVKVLSFGMDPWAGVVVLTLGGALLGLLGALLYVTPERIRRPLVNGLSVAAIIGLFQELLQLMLQKVEPVRATLFTWDGLRLQAAVAIVLVVAAGVAVWMHNRARVKARYSALPAAQQKGIRASAIAFGLLALFLFPVVAGNFIGQVFMLVGLYTLMGLGLNIELGLAGLLDLGFVAFFAVGAYTTALLTADSPHAIASWSYWQALPVAVVLSLAVGVLFGVPVLKVRGDYLAVATLGLGEIVRVLVISDMAAPVLAGAQGILNIPRPTIAGFELDNPVRLFYLTLVASAVVAYVAWRLENSRLGRAWTAIRDDEDVAQALGINLVNIKLLAYGLGAAFAGVAGSIFAVMLGSIFPHSFQLLISINVLALIIVGGMGSLPGVVVGAAVLIGVPELLREFGEYRFLFYGLVIVAMMRLKPEGLWPSAARRRELRGQEEAQSAIEAELKSGADAGTLASGAPEQKHE